MKLTIELSDKETLQIQKKCMILNMVYGDRNEVSPDATDAVILKIGKQLGIEKFEEKECVDV